MTRLSKSCLAMTVAFLAVLAFAQEGGEVKTIPLAEARATISEAVTNPEVMAETMKKLTPEDQVQYVAEVNAAIAKMPGSNEERSAIALNMNKVALKNAAPGNVANVLAEVFATAPVESLGVISENFAADLFNRDADPSHTYTDAQFTAIAEAMVKKIADRTANSDDNGVRSAFGMMMMVNASNGSIDNLPDTLSSALPAEVREVAKNEWAPAATGEEKSYDDMIAYSSESTATVEPNIPLTLQLAGPQMLDAMLSDVAAGVLVNNEAATPILDNAFGGFGENVIYSGDPSSSSTSISETTEVNKQSQDDAPFNPQGYPWQN